MRIIFFDRFLVAYGLADLFYRLSVLFHPYLAKPGVLFFTMNFSEAPQALVYTVRNSITWKLLLIEVFSAFPWASQPPQLVATLPWVNKSPCWYVMLTRKSSLRSVSKEIGWVFQWTISPYWKGVGKAYRLFSRLSIARVVASKLAVASGNWRGGWLWRPACPRRLQWCTQACLCERTFGWN